jgi:hypothetical protein
MLLSELIKAAKAALKEHGDMPVAVTEPGCGCCTYPDDFTDADSTEVKATKVGFHGSTVTAFRLT